MKVAMDQANKYMRNLMHCDRLLEELSEYIDGSLDPDRRRKIENHLRLCGTCAVLLDSLRKLVYIVGDDKVFMPPFECSHRWEELLSPPSKKRSASGQA